MTLFHVGFRVFYSDGSEKEEGETTDVEHEFHLDSDERIVKIIPTTGWMIDNLIFHSNKGRVYGPYGGPGGGLRDDDVPPENRNGFLAGVCGSIVRTQGSLGITSLSFKWGYYPLLKEISR